MVNCKVMKIKIFDIVIILVVAMLAFFSVYIVYLKPQGKMQVLIRGQNGEWTFPIEAEETIVVSGPIGNTIIKLQNNFAWVDTSPCDNQNCVAAGIVFRHGQWTACLPNNILLMIQGTGDDDVDSVAW